jgi:hypothetical protein
MAARMLRNLIAAALVLLTSGCSAGPASAPLESGAAWVPAQASLPAEVTRRGLVLEDVEGPKLCLGRILESLPPHCSGPEIVGWDWEAVEGETTAADTTWGHYRVVGTWDGDAFTLTRPAVSSSALEAPTGTDERGTDVPTCSPGGPPVLPALRDAMVEVVSVLTDLADGCVVVEVPYDDGTLQASVDERFGDAALVIGSSFSPVEG